MIDFTSKPGLAFAGKLPGAVIFLGLCCLTADAEDWTVQGKDYHNVTIQNVTEDHVEIIFDGGAGSVRLADLPPELQKRFNYDPQGSASARAAESAEIQKEAGRILTVKVGGTDIVLPEPPGMVEIPKDDPNSRAIGDLTPEDWLLLRSCISKEALDPAKAPDPEDDIMVSRLFAMKDTTMDIDFGEFIDFVEKTAFFAAHGVLQSKDSSFDYAETSKRFDQFQKDTGISIQANDNIYSLGMVSRSGSCVSFMTAETILATENGKTERRKCVSVAGYVLLRKKVLIVETSLNKITVLHEDLRALAETAIKYQVELQNLNNR